MLDWALWHADAAPAPTGVRTAQSAALPSKDQPACLTSGAANPEARPAEATAAQQAAPADPSELAEANAHNAAQHGITMAVSEAPVTAHKQLAGSQRPHQVDQAAPAEVQQLQVIGEVCDNLGVDGALGTDEEIAEAFQYLFGSPEQYLPQLQVSRHAQKPCNYF